MSIAKRIFVASTLVFGAVISAAELHVPSETSGPPDPADAKSTWDWAYFDFDEVSVDGISRKNSQVKWPESSVERERWNEHYRRELRRRGMLAWALHPSHEMRFRWLTATLDAQPGYFVDADEGAALSAAGARHLAKVDLAARRDWEVHFLAFKADAMREGRSGIWYWSTRYQCMQIAWYDAYQNQRRGLPVNLMPLADELVDFAFTAPESPWHEMSAGLAIWLLQLAASDRAMCDAIVAAFKLSPTRSLQEAARGWEQVQLLRMSPLQLAFPTFEGERFDLETLRGKTVLIDIWSSGCTTCLREMPYIQKALDHHGSAGFEVVGVWLAGAGKDLGTELANARSLAAKHGAKWTNLVLTADQAQEFRLRYGFHGVPVQWLLGPDGRLISNELFLGTALDERLQSLFSLPASPTTP